MTDATYAFVPWLRRGIATAITRPDGQADTKVRAEIAVATTFGPDDLTANTKLSLLGAGDVTGLDPRVVIRVWPRAGTYDAPANYLPLLELDQPDLPWRYTPARPDSKGRLRPWLCLIALKRGEFELTEPDATHPLPAVTVAANTPLPDLNQSWAWAHVHVTGVSKQVVSDAQKLGSAVSDQLTKDPKSVIARLLCPRRLEPRTPYTVFLVPTFKRGVLAGLGQPVPDTGDALDEAWTGKPAQPLELPVYYSWDFVSGEEADFEELVRRLNKTAVTDAGKRDLDVSAPGLGLPAVTKGGKPLGLEGALRAPGLAATAWDPATERDPWITQLKKLLDTPLTLTTTAGAARRFAPPLYGRWQARRDALGTAPASATAPWLWFDELNSDPRLRVAAAIGAHVVQSQQDQLMASAWRQVAGIRELNAELRHAQAAREIARRVHARHLAAADLEVALQLTAPVHARVRETAGDVTSPTLPARFRDSPIRPGLLTPQRRRVWRRMGPIARRQGSLLEGEPRQSTVLARLNDGSLRLAPPPQTPEQIASLGLLRLQPRAPLSSDPGGPPGFRPQELAPNDADTWFTASAEPGGGATGAGGELRDAIAGAWNVIEAPEPQPVKLRPVDLAAVRKRLVDELDPTTTIEAYYADARLELATPFAQTWKPADPLEPILAAPTFPNPMFEPLQELSQEWVIPGLEKVPPNTMALLETNARFINAYMVGLNHELSRELLWQGYPTDQRGTYFRQFWDPASYYVPLGQTLDPKLLEDIDPIAEWSTSGASSTIDKAGKKMQLPGGRLVLLLRGDLLARYPSLVLYAAPAKLKATDAQHPTRDPKQPDDRDLDADPAKEKQPIFGGTLRPDVSFFAFDIDKSKALASSSDPGWYFVLQEQDSEARFGLDVSKAASLKTWDDLSWADVNVALGDYIDLHANKPPVPSGTVPATWPDPNVASSTGTAADLAFITLQRRVRVSVHASDMIL